MNTANDENYFPIYLNTIRANTINTFNIYIRVVKNYVLYHSGSELLTEEVIKNLIDNKVSVIFIRNSEKDEYNRYIIDNLAEILSDPKTLIHEKATTAYSILSATARVLFEKPAAESLKIYKSSVSKVTDFVLLYEKAINNLIRMTSHQFDVSTHSINVGLFALGLAKTLMGNDPNHDLHEMAAGFFLHDIGKSMVPKNILTKRSSLTHNEWNMVKQHPFEGYKLLSRFNSLNENIKTIVMQHHERKNGKGYPRGLKNDEIHLYAKICCIADVFEALTSDRPYNKNNDKPRNSFRAFLTIKNEMHNEFDPFFFQQFILLFKDISRTEKRNTLLHP